MRFPKGLGPPHLSWVTLSLERLVALGTTESKDLEQKKTPE